MGSMKLLGRIFGVGLLLAMVATPREETPSAPYATEEVRYANEAAPGVELAGTFVKPRKDAPLPAVLLISGAGPQDRDETTAGHRPFFVLADYLAKHDIAVLRVDDRGTNKSSGDFDTATTKDFASDAQAGVRYLMTRQDIDQKHIGLIGHGEGANIAAILASTMPQISFAVLLSGTAFPGQKILLSQTVRAETAANLPPEQIDADFKLGSGLYRMAMAGRTAEEMKQALGTVPEEYKPFLNPWERQIPKLQSPWLRAFLSYDPSTALEKVTCPVLALFGGKDMTIDPDDNAGAMKKAFAKAHNRDARIKVLPGLNYLFQKANTGLASEYGRISETMAPVALETIQSWVSQQVGG